MKKAEKKLRELVNDLTAPKAVEILKKEGYFANAICINEKHLPTGVRVPAIIDGYEVFIQTDMEKAQIGTIFEMYRTVGKNSMQDAPRINYIGFNNLPCPAMSNGKVLRCETNYER